MTSPADRRRVAALPLLLALLVTLFAPPPSARPGSFAPPAANIAAGATGAATVASMPVAAVSAWPGALAVVASIGSTAAAPFLPGAVAAARHSTLAPPTPTWSAPLRSTVDRPHAGPLLAFQGRAPPA